MTASAFPQPHRSPLVSVVAPTYHGERFISAALESVAEQTYPAIEIVVVEDGSRGPTEGIVRSFASRWSGRVAYERLPENRGTSVARNRALQLSRGDYIALLDCDDLWLPSHLTACVGALESSGEDVAYSTAAMFDDSDETISGRWGPNDQELAEFPASLLGRNFVTPSATVLRRRVFDAIGGFDPGISLCEDADLFQRAAAHGFRFRRLAGDHCLYRKGHAEATTVRMAATLERFAKVSVRHLGITGEPCPLARRYAARALVAAAKTHARGDSGRDPSVDRRRAAPLSLQAWRLNKRRVELLAKTVVFAARFGWGSTDILPKQHAPSVDPQRAAA